MKLPFRKHHLLKALNEWNESSLPLDLFLKNYFRVHRSIGSKDRKAICEWIYEIIRWKGYIDFFLSSRTWDERLSFYFDHFQTSSSKTLPSHVKVSFPKWLFELFENTYSKKEALKLCGILNQRAPTTLRANLLKTNRKELLSLLKEYSPQKCTFSPVGIQLGKTENFYALESYKNGLFEVQDEGSQIIGQSLHAAPKKQILDFCAGAGGKTLAFAPYMNQSGQIYLHDPRKNALEQAKKRLKRAGIQNFQIVPFKSKKLQKLKNQMDIVILDAPCSGTGTLRRNPDMKWKLTKEKVLELVGLQRKIFEESLNYVKKGGKVFYITCSLLEEENQSQVEYFQKNFPVELVSTPCLLPPLSEGMDGFFMALLKKR